MEAEHPLHNLLLQQQGWSQTEAIASTKASGGRPCKHVQHQPSVVQERLPQMTRKQRDCDADLSHYFKDQRVILDQEVKIRSRKQMKTFRIGVRDMDLKTIMLLKNMYRSWQT
jgi:hypothetical protein